jgi:uncharacterized membrane protein
MRASDTTQRGHEAEVRAEIQTEARTGIRTEGLDRLLFFSDGVFAIAITLLILDIRLPSIEAPLNNTQLLQELLALWPKVAAYLLSFAVIATFWVKHHTAFRYIKAYDSRLILLNMLLLSVIAFIPFPTAVMRSQPNGVAWAFYSLTMALGFILSTLIWRHATHGNHLVSDDLDPYTRRVILISPMIAGGIFLLSAGLALVRPSWGSLTLLLLIPAANSRLWSKRDKHTD